MTNSHTATGEHSTKKTARLARCSEAKGTHEKKFQNRDRFAAGVMVAIAALLESHAPKASESIGELGWSTLDLGFPDGALLTQFSSATNFAWFLVMFSFPQLLLEAAAFQKLLEAPQSRTDRFSVVNAHP